MLGEVLEFLKDRVHDHLRTGAGWRPPEMEPDLVAFPRGEQVDASCFELGRVTLLVVNLEEDHTLRPADPYRRSLPDGTTEQVQPPIHINAYILFVARFSEYKTSLRHLSRVLQFFQGHRVFDHESAPELADSVEKLTLELLTLPFSEQNHLWGVLRASYHPSLLYKVRMVVFSEEQGSAPPRITETTTTAVAEVRP